MQLPSSLLVPLVVLTIPLESISAQSADTTDRERADRGRGCILPRPLPRCATFLVTEVGFSKAAVPYDPDDRSAFRGLQVHWELGYMMNRPNRCAVGGSLMWAVTEERVRLGLKVRRRWWMSDVIAVDVSPGITLDRITEAAYESQRLGFTANAGVNLRDYVGIVAQVDVIQGGRPGWGTDVFVGVQFGSAAGAFLGYVLPAAMAIGS